MHFLDLAVPQGGYASRLQTLIYRNNRNGTLTLLTNSAVSADLRNGEGCAWGDYDNDGFLDLFVANGFFVTSANNLLYRNNGNSNSWLNLRLIGTVSNRSAIGAKVRLHATIGGKTFWQLREISGGSGFGSQNDMRANFGLGDATDADIVRIEWPSGIVQDTVQVGVDRLVRIRERDTRLGVPAPSPVGLALETPAPNPFGGAARITYRVPVATAGALRAADTARGEQVARYVTSRHGSAPQASSSTAPAERHVRA